MTAHASQSASSSDLVAGTESIGDVDAYMERLGRAARAAAAEMRRSATGAKNAALLAMAERLTEARTELLAANARDLARGQESGLDAALLDRLALDDGRLDAMVEGLAQVAALPDPVGEIDGLRSRPSGIQVGQMRVPLGVIGIIYESRPNVTLEAASLCLKSGNVCILRGGSEARDSNAAIAACIRAGLRDAGLPEAAVQVVATTDRAAVGRLIAMPEYVDVIIPRGGKSLIERISREARVPVIKHLDGVCHVYIDERADLEKATAIAYNAKTQRYGTCNTMETLLVAQAVAASVLGRLGPLYREAGVELRGCEQTRKVLPEALAATEADWSTEYLGPILSVRVVSGLDKAIDHIRRYGHDSETLSIVYVIDEPARAGFAYGTLPGHLESGEERFTVQRGAEGTITFTVAAFSNPATLLARAGGPVTRWAQAAMTTRYLKSIEPDLWTAGPTPPYSR